mgnify:CR=1 FL=1
MKAESDLLMQKQRVESIRSKRAIAAVKQDKFIGTQMATGELTGATAAESAYPRYGSKRRGGTASYGSRAMPTLQIGGHFRPQ